MKSIGMIRIFLILILLIFSNVGQAQFEQNNKWSLDLNGGATNAVKPYATGYFSNTVGLFHASGGLRYMFNNKYGIKVDGGFDRIKNDEFGSNGNSFEFRTNYMRSSLQLILDIGRAFKFENFSNHVSLLFHTGGGLSQIKSVDDGLSDKMFNYVVGFTPQIKLGNRVALVADISFIWHIYQQYTFDMTQSHSQRGFDGFLANGSLGLNFYLGKNETHMDWAYTPCFPDMSYLDVEIKKLDSTNQNLTKKLRDDDGDGIINVMDDEPNTPKGNTVDCKGKTIDLSVNPDPTPDPDPTPVIIDKSNLTTIGDINFGLNQSYVQGKFYNVLNETANILKSDASLNILLTGHADITGGEDLNLVLAKKRAESIKKYLISRGINASRIEAVSFGETKPKFLSTTAAGRALNRRVEVYIQNK